VIRLYAAETERLLEKERWRSLISKLPQSRQQRILSCRLSRDRAALCGAGLLLRQALCDCGIAPDEQIFAENRWGKPQLAGMETPQFSLSHGGGWAVCAVADTPLGVDVELPRCTMAVAERWFCREEVQAVQTLPYEEWADALLRIWTAKEAFLKALGRGLTLPLNSFAVDLDEPAQLRQDYSDAPWRLEEYRLGAARVCLCTTEPRPKLEILDIG